MTPALPPAPAAPEAEAALEAETPLEAAPDAEWEPAHDAPPPAMDPTDDFMSALRHAASTWTEDDAATRTLVEHVDDDGPRAG